MLRTSRASLQTDARPGESIHNIPRLSPSERSSMFRIRPVQVGASRGSSIQCDGRPAYDKKIAPICPACGKKAQLVSRDELFPFRDDNKKLADLYYVCCGQFAIADSKTLKRKSPFAGYMDRRLREEARKVVRQMTMALFGYGCSSSAATKGAHAFICEQLQINTLDIATADARQCRDIIRICYARLRDFGKTGYGFR